MILSAWVVVGFGVLVLNLQRIFKAAELAVVVMIIGMLFLVRLLDGLNISFEALPLSSTFIFASLSMVADQVTISRDRYKFVLIILLSTICAAMLYAFYGSIDFLYKYANILATGGRYAIFYDNITALIGVIIGFVVYSAYWSGYFFKILAVSSIVLSLFRLVSFASIGSVVFGFVIVVVHFWRHRHNKKNLCWLVAAVVLIIYIVSRGFSDFILHYSNVSKLRLRESYTLAARLSEAANDYCAFLEKPLFGWGRSVPGENILGEPSRGHVAATGMLARFGIVGTTGFVLYYVAYFRRVYRRGKWLAKSCPEFRDIFVGILILTLYLTVMGNPLLLFPAWSFLPLIFPKFSTDKD